MGDWGLSLGGRCACAMGQSAGHACMGRAMGQAEVNVSCPSIPPAMPPPSPPPSGYGAVPHPVLPTICHHERPCPPALLVPPLPPFPSLSPSPLPLLVMTLDPPCPPAPLPPPYQVTVLSLITGSLFYQLPVTMSGARSLFGACFMSVLFMAFGGFPQMPMVLELKKVCGAGERAGSHFIYRSFICKAGPVCRSCIPSIVTRCAPPPPHPTHTSRNDVDKDDKDGLPQIELASCHDMTKPPPSPHPPTHPTHTSP